MHDALNTVKLSEFVDCNRLCLWAKSSVKEQSDQQGRGWHTTALFNSPL